MNVKSNLSFQSSDLACAALIVSPTRETVVDFTYPFMATTLAAIFQKPTAGEKAVTSFHDLMESDMTVITHYPGFIYNSLITSNNPVIKKLAGKMVPLQTRTLRECLVYVLSNRCALLCPRDHACRFVHWYPDVLTRVESSYMTRYYALATPKGSPLCRMFGRTILEMVEEGIVDELIDKWLCNHRKPPADVD